MKVKYEGSNDLRFEVVFRVVRASGKVETTNIFCFDSLLQAEELITKFFDIRSGVAMGSYTLFGGGRPVQSLGWLACHSCYVKIYDALEDVETYSEFVMHPYTEHILRSVD